MATFRTEPVDQFYQIGEDIGSGQFSEVKRVMEKSSGRDYAGKFIRKRRSAASRRGVRREDIVREVNILQELSHANIISLHDAFETQKEIVLILELVAGGELFHYLAEEDQVSEEKAAQFLKKILDGLKHMHDRNICHLDLKPENIMLLNRNTQNIMLIDFGLSRRILPGEDVRDMIGTAEFVAPEVINFEPLNLATDMWAIGVITYILLSGLSPFLGDDQQETYENVTALNYSFDEDYFSSTSDLAKDFINQLLIKDPRKRATVDQCLSHPWIKPRSTKQKVQRQTSHLNMQNLRKFNARKRWKQSMKVVSICNKLSKNARLRSASTAVDVSGASLSQTANVSIATEGVEEEEEEHLENDGIEMGTVKDGNSHSMKSRFDSNGNKSVIAENAAHSVEQSWSTASFETQSARDANDNINPQSTIKGNTNSESLLGGGYCSSGKNNQEFSGQESPKEIFFTEGNGGELNSDAAGSSVGSENLPDRIEIDSEEVLMFTACVIVVFACFLFLQLW